MMQVLLLLNVVILSLLVYVVWRDLQRHTTHINLDKVIDGLAGRLINMYIDDLRAIGEAGALDYFRKHYIQLVTDYGFPIAQTDAVCMAAWLIVQNAQNKQPVRSDTEVALYE